MAKSIIITGPAASGKTFMIDVLRTFCDSVFMALPSISYTSEMLLKYSVVVFEECHKDDIISIQKFKEQSGLEKSIFIYCTAEEIPVDIAPDRFIVVCPNFNGVYLQHVWMNSEPERFIKMVNDFRTTFSKEEEAMNAEQFLKNINDSKTQFTKESEESNA